MVLNCLQMVGFPLCSGCVILHYHNFFSHSFIGDPLVVPVLQPLKMVVQYVVSLAMGYYHQVLEDKQEKSKYPTIFECSVGPY